MPHLQTIDPALIQTIVQQLQSISDQTTANTEAIKNLQSDWSKWLPAIITGIVGVLTTLVTGAIGFYSYKIAKKQTKNTERQIDSSSHIARDHIRSAQEIAEKQIRSTASVAISDIKAKTISVSRKEWIESLRAKASKHLALANAIHNLSVNDELFSHLTDEVWELSFYIELMLNFSESNHRKFFSSLTSFTTLCMKGDKDIEKWASENKLYIERLKSILKEEWERVKKFE